MPTHITAAIRRLYEEGVGPADAAKRLNVRKRDISYAYVELGRLKEQGAEYVEPPPLPPVVRPDEARKIAQQEAGQVRAYSASDGVVGSSGDCGNLALTYNQIALGPDGEFFEAGGYQTADGVVKPGYMLEHKNPTKRDWHKLKKPVPKPK